MHNRTLNRGALALGVLATVAVTACMTPPEASLGQPVTQNDVSITVVGAELKYLDLEGPSGGVQTDAPLLELRLTVTNAGLEPVRYDLAWGASAATQAQTALLFVDPGPDAEPTSGTPIARALLNTVSYLADPVTEARSIAAGESIEDILLFDAPPAGAAGLVLSLPPTVFGPSTKLPAYVRVPWTAQEVAPPAPVELGTAHVGPGFSFTVTSATTVWPRLRDTSVNVEGFSERPLLRVDFTLANTSEATIEYIPAAASNRFQPPVMTTGDGAPLPRATFPTGVVPVGAQTERKQVGAGESFSGFVLFERPPAEVTSLNLVIPGARFGSTGIVRVTVPYTFANPPEPAELTPQVVDAPPQ